MRASRLFKGITLAALLLLYVPLVVLVTYSFLSDLDPTTGQRAWTWAWYMKAFSNQTVLEALRVSLWVGFWTTLLATCIGTAAAFAMERYRFFGRTVLDGMIHVPLIMPEIVLGLSMLAWFGLLRLTLGVFSIILAHVTFSVSYVIITVRARLAGFDMSLEEAARDLGASSWQTFRHVTLPLTAPGILSGAVMAFTLSFDDFLITFFTAGVGSDTLPVKLYSMIKFGVSPEINALSTVLIGVTLVLVLTFSRSAAARS